MRATMRRVLVILAGLALALAGVVAGRAVPAAAAAPCVVTTLTDNVAAPPAGSLREKVADSTCGAITFQSSTGTVTLQGNLPTITRTLSITGTIFITRGDPFTSTAVIFDLGAGADLTLNGLLLERARYAVRSTDPAARLTVTNGFFSSNYAAVAFTGAAGGSATITGSGFSSNANAAIQTDSGTSVSITLANSTVMSGGTAGLLLGGGTATVVNTTFSGNGGAGTAHGNLVLDGGATATLTNTLLARKATSANCAGSNLAGLTARNDLADDGTCFSDGSNGNLVRTAGTNPLGLDPGGLKANGGPTNTIALLPGSPAIDAGDATTCALAPVSAVDQRGVARPQGAACDIGAVELRTCAVANTNDTGGGSLRAALADATCTAIDATGVSGTITLTNGNLPSVSRTAIVTGPGAAGLTVNRGSTAPGTTAFTLQAGGDLTLTRLTVTGATAGLYFSGSGTATLTTVTLSGNTNALYFSGNGVAALVNSTLSGNTYGINVVSGGTATLLNSTVSGNSYGLFLSGGGVATLTNTILAKGANANCTLIAGRFTPGIAGATSNLADDSSCFTDGSNGNLVRAGGTNPLGLDPAGLKDNGGPTQTVALLPTSPAVNAGNATACTNAPVSGVDQRGITRPSGACASGAFEPRTCVVTSTGDSGAGTLREKLLDLTCSAIDATGVSGTITLSSGNLPTVSRVVTVTGPGASRLTVDRTSTAFPATAFRVGAGGAVTLTGLTVSGAGSGLFVADGGTATLASTTISGNTYGLYLDRTGSAATLTGSTVSGNAYGLYLYNNGATATLANTTISDNTNFGLYFDSGGTATLANSTVSGNADTGLYFFGGGTATLANTTISGGTNGLSFVAGGRAALTNVTVSGSAKGLYFNGVGGGATLANTLLANKGTSAVNCAFNNGATTSAVTNQTSNLADDTTCGFGGTTGIVLDPGGLKDNGGPTKTIALVPGNPAAIDQGDPTTCANAPVGGVDQRGTTRPQGAKCDIGAFEFVPVATTTAAGGPFTAAVTAANVTLTATVTSTSTVGAGTVTFTVYDSGNNPVGSPVQGTVSNGAASAPFPLTSVGLGTYTVAASYSGGAGFLASDATPPGTLTVTPGPATRFRVDAPSAATAGSPFTVTVTALDARGNVATGDTGTVHFTSSDSQAILPVDSTLTNGVGTFSATLRTAGDRTITATDTGNSAIAGTSGTITVGAGLAVSFTVGAPPTANAGNAFTVTVTALDQFGNRATGYTGTVRFSGTDGQATLPPDSTLTAGTGTFSATLRTAGDRTITATDTGTSSIAGTSNAITVGAGPATRLRVDAPATAVPGVPFDVTVTAQDRFGNVTTGYAGTVRFSGGGAGATLPGDSTLTNGARIFPGGATLATVGGQTIVATDTANGGLTGSAVVQVGKLATGLSVSGGGTYGGTATLTATLTRSGGAPVAGATVTFRLDGAIVGSAPTDASGVATLPNVGLAGRNAGSYALGASFAGDGTSQGSAATGTLAVTRQELWLKPVNQTVKRGAVSTLPTGSACALQVVAGKPGGLVGADTLASATNPAYLRCTYGATNASVPGSYPIVATGVTSTNYVIKWATGTLTVTP